MSLAGGEASTLAPGFHHVHCLCSSRLGGRDMRRLSRDSLVLKTLTEMRFKAITSKQHAGKPVNNKVQ